MEKFIPITKRSKKEQKAANAKKRTMWAQNPVTRMPAPPHAYSRAKAARAARMEELT